MLQITAVITGLPWWCFVLVTMITAKMVVQMLYILSSLANYLCTISSYVHYIQVLPCEYHFEYDSIHPDYCSNLQREVVITIVDMTIHYQRHILQ